MASPLATILGVLVLGAAVRGAVPSLPNDPEPTTPEALVFPTAAVAADHTLASQAGLEVLRAGGNAVDAAVATSFALSVVRPYSCGIGGGGFMVVFLKHHPRLAELTAGRGGVLTTCINYRETSIGAMGPEFFEKDADPDAATRGGKAVAIPGHVAGMLHALEKYGVLPREKVLAPAIRLAEAGYAADAHYVSSSQEIIEWINGAPGRAERFPDLWNRLLMKGQVKVGDHIDMTGQAKVLRAIAAEGARAFYRGPVADAIVKAVRADQGLMTLDDLRGYAVEERAPLVTSFRGDTVLSMPPPSSGGIVLAQVLGMIEAREADFTRIVKTNGHNSPEYIHFVAEASKHAFADRARWMGDPNFVDVPVKSLLSAAYIADRAAQIDLTRVLPTDQYGTAEPLPEDHGTSHLCVVDAWGNSVACSETINLVFGSLVSVEEYGFILNDTVDDFLTRTGEPNAFGLDHAALNKPEPGKRPLSCMSPTIVVNDAPDASVPAISRVPKRPGELSGGARVVFIGGGSGGPRIISGTIQATLNSMVFGMSSAEALAKPRFHHQWHPDVLQLEKELRGTETEAVLKSRYGHQTGPRDPVAAVQIIRAVDGGWSPASDPRKGGAPAGY
ncbi:MAG: gamma-glutamyltransferase family protein [Phycisphaerales bacterium]